LSEAISSPHQISLLFTLPLWPSPSFIFSNFLLSFLVKVIHPKALEFELDTLLKQAIVL